MANIHLYILGVVVIACRFVLIMFSRYHDDGARGKHDGETGYFE